MIADSRYPLFGSKHANCLLFFLLLVWAISFLSGCGPGPTPAAPSPVPPQPTASPTQLPATESASSLLQAGKSYSDASGDMEVSFLDVTGFQATVNEEAEVLEVTLNLRDIPETATRRQMRNQVEYMWEISIFTDPAKFDMTDAQPDYWLFLMTIETDPPTGQEFLTPEPGEPETVPIDQLWDSRIVNNEQGDYLYDLQVTADPDRDTITMQARIPEMTAGAAFRFATVNYDGTIDRPDNYISPELATLSTPVSESDQTPQTSSNIPASDDPAQLTPAGTVTA